MSHAFNEQMGRFSLSASAEGGGHLGRGGEGVVPTHGVIRKQRSQRFAIPLTLPHPSLPPAPSSLHLPYQQSPPLPVSQAQTTDPFYFPPTNRPMSNSYVRDDASPTYPSNPAMFQPPQYQSQSGAYSSVSTNATFASGRSGGSSYSTPASSYRREVGTRAALPTEWMGRAPAPGGGQDTRQEGYAALTGRGVVEDDVIPTAIVIKNIPFHVPKETLLGIMEDLQLPPPFAFNYHFDAGQFRGLAFANFRGADEAALTVTALNGFDLQGRKLRTEFKKVLKEGEKERIEKNKAVARLRSQRDLRGEAANGPPMGSWNRREASAPAGYPADEEDYGRQIVGQYSSVVGSARSHATRDYVSAEVPSFAPPMSAPPRLATPPTATGMGYGHVKRACWNGRPTSGNSSGRGDGRVGSTSGSEGSQVRLELDLNDPPTLEIYSLILIFRDDALRDELSFAKSLGPDQRRAVELVAEKLGLRCSKAERILVYKGGAREDLIDIPQRQPPQFIPNPSFQNPHPIPTYSSLSLGGKKSLPDLRSSQSSNSLRAAYATIGSGRTTTGRATSPYDAPGPDLGDARGGRNESEGAVWATRQPRGPAEGGWGRRGTEERGREE